MIFGDLRLDSSLGNAIQKISSTKGCFLGLGGGDPRITLERYWTLVILSGVGDGFLFRTLTLASKEIKAIFLSIQ